MLSFIIEDGLAYSPFRVFVTPSAPFALLTMLVPLKRATILLVCFGMMPLPYKKQGSIT